MSEFDIIRIVQNAKKIALTDALESLMIEHMRLKKVNPEMAKGLHLAIVYLRSQRSDTK